MQSNNTLIQISPKHTLREEFVATLETSKLFIIPLSTIKTNPQTEFLPPSIHCIVDFLVAQLETEI
jgi:hypothetical protein